jgi:lipid A 3-O-deacylase
MIGKKRTALIFLFILFHLAVGTLTAQTDSVPSHLFRVYEDDDYFNDLGRGTDKAYTSGEQLTYFYNRKKTPHFFIDHWLPKAGDSSINTYGISLLQIMYTPDYLTAVYYVPDDYSYAGALLARHSLYSCNQQKNYAFQTEIVGGVIGPASLAGQAQYWLHTHLADTAVPHGWANQYRNDVLLNIDFTAEKLLYSNHKYVELTGSATANAGTFFDAIDISPALRIGKMKPYFDGFINRFSTSIAKSETGWKKVQLYFILKPGIQYVLYSAMLQGGMFTPPPTVTTFVDINGVRTQIYFTKPKQYIENYVGYITYGPLMAYRHWSASFTQTYSTRVLKGVYPYIYGNVTLYYGW